MNKHITEDLIRLRDELMQQAFSARGCVKDATLAQVVYKLNSCLYKGYPRRTTNEHKS